jgi:serine/threonine-protein kinase
VKLIDFGVIAVADRKHDGMFVGTWRYAAPEQIRGERATPATDLYAVGLVLYEMLAGRGPFDEYESGSEVSQAHLREIPRPVSELAPWVPPSVVQLIESALSKHPRSRPRDAHAFAERLCELESARDDTSPREAKNDAPVVKHVLDSIGAAKPPEPASATTDEDALLAGLAARPDERVPSKKSRESGEAARVMTPSPGQVVIRPSAPQIERSPTAATLDSDTFASQQSDPRTAPRRGARLILPLALAAFAVAGIVSVVLFLKLRAGPDTKAPAEAPPSSSVLPAPVTASAVAAPEPAPLPVISVSTAPPTPSATPRIVRPSGRPSTMPSTRRRDDFMRGGP